MSKIIDNNNKLELKSILTTKNPENFTNNEIIINEIENFENKKEIRTETLILNEFWVDLISKLIINLNIIYMENIPIMFYILFDNKSIDISYICSNLYKYIFFFQFVPQFSIILNSLTTFSRVVNKTNKIKKFYIINIIKAIIFYFISVVLLYLIKNPLYKHLYKHIKKLQEEFYDIFNVLDVLDSFIDFLLRFIGNFLANFNTNLDILIIGSLYIFLFKNPKKLVGKKLFHFRLMSILPILFVVISIIYRALVYKNIISLNIYIFPLFVGPKVSIFGFFITTLLYLKYKSKEYLIFDENNCVIVKVFSKIGGKIFADFGYLELFFEYFLNELKFIGIGNQYLLLFAVPFILIYDYKKKKEKIICPICKKRNIKCCINLLIYYLYFMIFIFGLCDVFIFIDIIKKYIKPIVNFIKEHYKEIKKIIKELGIV